MAPAGTKQFLRLILDYALLIPAHSYLLTHTCSMKAIQFVYPMFLVALGLHASILFVPIGPNEPDPALIEEDVPLASMTEAPQPSKFGALPVPDPNVTTGTAQIGTVPLPALFKPARVTTQPVPPPTAVAIRTAPPPSPTTPSTGTGTSANSSMPVSTPTTTASPVPNEPVSTPNMPRSGLPDLTTGQEEEAVASNSGTSNAANSNSVSIADPPSLSNLVASAQTDASSFLAALLEDLSDGLTYRPENADELSAQRNLEEWKTNFSQQANAAQIENVEPIFVTDIELAYPIESAEMMNGGSLSVCLDESPNNAQIGLLFGSDSELVGSPTLIQSTGYDTLNLEVSALIMKANNLPDNRASKAYVYDVSVNYDAETCVSLKALKN